MRRIEIVASNGNGLSSDAPHFLVGFPERIGESGNSYGRESGKSSGAAIQEPSNFEEKERREIVNGAVFLAGLGALAYLALKAG
jgi:hypothetical protein